MKITKLGHSCFIAEPKEGVRVMTDPGAYSTLAADAKNISAIVITHEHSDHIDIQTLQKILTNNPEAKIFTNTAVGKILDEAGIKYEILEEGQKTDVKGVSIQAFGNVHAEIYPSIGPFQNTGYLIDTLYHPGDAFYYPDADIEILALPVAAPWLKTQEAVDYVKNMNHKPKVVFAIHDAFLKEISEAFYRWPQNLLKDTGIIFKKLELGQEEDL